ncbi:glycoside hydrolase family 78 protein [Solirubrobacter ginsenosidimutans]|uniref:alpha-L-rhamnosidase n=1 Tax=Solirubrobacter ginsenosidimutans TaxID=490573 RepID=A0A9X3S331_9ACTN|nr:family 78 glycoside hydrolase catalytic domain [Solirubrobacter ginsenosidimutans]MDA0165255.1 glycoside hydrolase family 78 protein [Solirubrobacter ginsenosidimutans]
MFSRAFAGAALVAALVVPSTASAAPLTVSGLTADRQSEPLGLGDARPSLGWKLTGDGRGREQSAYQVIVSKDGADVWDSGEVHSSASANVPFGGPALASGTKYAWKVRVWDETGAPSAYSAPATLETGLLQQSDWTAKWIGAPANDLNFSGDKWIWFTNDDATNNMPANTRYLRASVNLAAAPTEARFLFTVDDEAIVYVNGTQVIDTKAIRDADENAWQKAKLLDVTSLLHQGANTLAVQVKNRLNQNGAQTPGGFIARLKADTTTLDTSSAWKSSTTGPDGWQQPGFDDTAWTPARELATYGSGPWGANVSLPPQPSPYLRKEFNAAKAIADARLYVSALGLYEVRINGSKVGDAVLAPGWTEYSKRVPSQTYDVTSLVKQGANAIGAVLGDGWYAGRLQGGRTWGTNPGLIAQLKLTYTDGTTARIATDNTWQAGRGGLQATSIYDGETYDARLDRPGWDQPNFAGNWPNAVERTETTAVEPSQAPPIRVLQTLQPVKVTQPTAGTTIYDLGQNFAGWARITAHGAAGTTIKLRFGEILNQDGTLYTTNLRSALQTDTYTLRGGAEETYEPRFTYHGFRYVEVTGGTVDSLEGREVSSDLPDYGTFTSSNPLVNQIQSAIRWGQRSNFLGVPSDASQRDERLGWTGDIQAFASTGAFNEDASGFLGQWMQTMRDSQTAAGAFPDVAPVTCCGEGTAGWGDAGTVVPWALYRRYGDPRVLQANYDAMTRWIAYLKANSSNLIRPNQGYGDWLAPDGSTPLDFIGTAFFAYSTDIVRQAAQVLGKDEDAATYASLYSQIKSAFDARWVHADGTVGSNSQTSYVLALKFGLVPDNLKTQAFNRLVDDVVSRGDHLSTGFLGTPFLLSVLQDGGRGDVAYKILTQDSYPSWGYMMGRGGTTIWERWDGIRPDGSLQDAGMNSFNHYGLGSIGDWLYDSVGGLAPQTPGYKTQLVKPSTGAELSSASSAVKTNYGDAKTSWSRDAAGRLSIDVDVPVNTRAEVHVPLTDGQQALESGKPAAQQPGVTYKGTSNGDAVYEVGSGSYRFLAAIVDATSVNGDVTARVPATLALTLNSPVSFGALTPGVAKDYTADLAASVTSTAGDAALTVHDPSATAPGHLVNGAFALPQALKLNGTAVAGASNPTQLATWTGPVSNDPVTVHLLQPVAATDPLRTGSYTKTLTFTLSTTTP